MSLEGEIWQNHGDLLQCFTWRTAWNSVSARSPRENFLRKAHHPQSFHEGANCVCLLGFKFANVLAQKSPAVWRHLLCSFISLLIFVTGPETSCKMKETEN